MNAKQDGPVESPQLLDWHELALSHFAVMTYTQLIATKRIRYFSIRKCLIALMKKAFKTYIDRAIRLHLAGPLSPIKLYAVGLRII